MAEGARAHHKAPHLAPVNESTVSIEVQGGKTNPVALDPIIHVRVRLGIVSALAVEESLTFNELKERLDTSDGNLSVH
ncbi:MAG: transcriptional regulator, partial [Gemmatimonadota bacterium]